MGRVVVAGSINMDVVATADRHPRIGQTVAGRAVNFHPGGKGANQAVAAARLGAPTTLIGRIGQDAFGEELKRFLAAERIDLSQLRETPGMSTGTAIITIAQADNTIVVIPGANARLEIADTASKALAAGDVAISQFEIPIPTITAFFRQARAAGATTILNPAPAIAFDHALLDLVDILILNETELGELANTTLDAVDDARHFIDAMSALQTGRGLSICVTLGKRGVLALLDGAPLIIEGRAVKAVDSTGAGDCFVGAVAAQLASGHPLGDALAYANRAAAISVQRIGAAPSMPTAAELAIEPA